jgi:cytosine/uracil/thiamine/allantoin permease
MLVSDKSGFGSESKETDWAALLVMGSNSALLVTVPDIARYSKHPRDQLWGQLLGLPIAQTLCAAFGIITTVGIACWFYRLHFDYEFVCSLQSSICGVTRIGRRMTS